MMSAHATITLHGHRGWVRETISLPLELQINIDDMLIDCRIDSARLDSVELEQSFDAIISFDWSDDWDAIDLRGRVFVLQYGTQVLGQARVLSGLEET